MIKTPLSTVIGGAFWTPGCTVIGGQQSFSQLIKKLFANNEQGFFYDPSDLSTMFQDAAGTVPVSGVGQPVWHILDKSGNNNHAFATSSATRPILQRNATTGAYYLAFDGADDFLVTNSIDFTSTDKVSLFAGVRKLSDAVIGSIVDGRGVDTGFEIYAPSSASARNYVFATLVGATRTYLSSSEAIAPASNVITTKLDISNNRKTITVDREETSGFVGTATGSLSNHTIYIGRRGGTSLSFNGHIYGLIGVGKLVSDTETTAIEKELAKRTGVTLNV